MSKLNLSRRICLSQKPAVYLLVSIMAYNRLKFRGLRPSKLWEITLKFPKICFWHVRIIEKQKLGKPDSEVVGNLKFSPWFSYFCDINHYICMAKKIRQIRTKKVSDFLRKSTTCLVLFVNFSVNYWFSHQPHYL